MAYKYEEFIDAMRFGLTMSDRDTTDDIWKTVDEVVNKAKAFDEITKLEKQTSLYSVVGKEDVELGIEIRKIINKYNDRYKESANDERGND